MGGIFNSTVLDVAIGLVFIYLLLAILCTAINEYISRQMAKRGKFLANGIIGMLSPSPVENPVTSPAALASGKIAKLTKSAANPPVTSPAALASSASANPATPAPNPNAVEPVMANDDKINLIKEFYAHGLISALCQTGDQHPSYIKAETFAATVIDVLAKTGGAAVTVADIKAGVEKLPEGKARQALLAIVSRGGVDVANAQKGIEDWYNDTMDRVTGWYKRHIQIVTLLVAIVLTIMLNADTVSIARRLWKDPVVRARIVEAAKLREQKPAPVANPVAGATADQTTTQATGPVLTPSEQSILGDLLGWDPQQLHRQSPLEIKWGIWGLRFLGWLLTIFAISLGAPFWFDVLSKVMNLRSSGPAATPATKPT